ncbi:hypothetical protein N5V81_14175 [Escherichia coli]|nr:hypothetical protein [Escherichia coli]
MFSRRVGNQVAIKGHSIGPSAITLLAAHVKKQQPAYTQSQEQLNRSAGNGHLLQQVLSAIAALVNQSTKTSNGLAVASLFVIGNAYA